MIMRGVLYVACLAFVASVGGERTYSDLCDQIVEHAQQASRLHNAGQIKAAMDKVDAARQTFQAAVSIDPDEPQAYFNMANFLLNTQHLEESIPLWQAAADRVGPGDMQNFLLQKKVYATFGVHSMRRDAAYKNGEGNLSEALVHAQGQLGVYRSPEVYFDMATMQTMLASVGMASSTDAMQNFREAQNVAYRAWTLGLASRDPRYPLDSSRTIQCVDVSQRGQSAAPSLTTHGEVTAQSQDFITYDWKTLDSANNSMWITFPPQFQPGSVFANETTYGRNLKTPHDPYTCGAEDCAATDTLVPDMSTSLFYAFRQTRQPM